MHVNCRKIVEKIANRRQIVENNADKLSKTAQTRFDELGSSTNWSSTNWGVRRTGDLTQFDELEFDELGFDELRLYHVGCSTGDTVIPQHALLCHLLIGGENFTAIIICKVGTHGYQPS
jgi:hypothetical protein